MFYSCLERKNDKVLTFTILHCPNFEIGAAPHAGSAYYFIIIIIIYLFIYLTLTKS